MKLKLVLLFLSMCLLACNTSKHIATSDSFDNKLLKNSSESENNALTWGSMDSINQEDIYDGFGGSIFGRKIIYRDISATKAAVDVSGIVVNKVCINREGLVTYVELVGSETTIKDREVLRRYLKAARGYKFQPDISAPVQQCGKLTFIIDNIANRRQ